MLGENETPHPSKTRPGRGRLPDFVSHWSKEGTVPLTLFAFEVNSRSIILNPVSTVTIQSEPNKTNIIGN